MSKATFPNTTRRRLSSCVVCRLSSSVVVCRCFLFSKVSFFSHYPLLHTDKKPPKRVRGTQHVRASRDQVWLCQIQVIWVSRFVPENRRERAQRPVAVTTLEGLWPVAWRACGVSPSESDGGSLITRNRQILHKKRRQAGQLPVQLGPSTSARLKSSRTVSGKTA